MLHNAKNGFLEGALRGCHAGLLSTHDYSKLILCETLDDVKTFLVVFGWGEACSSSTWTMLFYSAVQTIVRSCKTYHHPSFLQQLPQRAHRNGWTNSMLFVRRYASRLSELYF